MQAVTGLVLRTVAILVLLQYSAMAGIWLFPPWWTPYVLMGLHMLMSMRLRRRLHRRAPVAIPWKITEIVVSLLAVIGAIFLALPAYQGRDAPDAVIDLAMPLGPGRYLVISGGATPAITGHYAPASTPVAPSILPRASMSKTAAWPIMAPPASETNGKNGVSIAQSLHVLRPRIR